MIKKFFQLYNLLLTSVITISAFSGIKGPADTFFPLLILPLNLYFLRLFFNFRSVPATVSVSADALDTSFNPTPPYSPQTPSSHPIYTPTPSISSPPRGRKARSLPQDEILIPQVLSEKQVKDIDRRLFLKLIGSAGMTTFIFSLFTNRAHAAFFGSMPGPGTVALKNSAGVPIDPAEKYPTSGYKIAQLDDTSSATYAYYGFLDKTGAWYLQREQLTGVDTGQYLYSKGASDFSTAWTNRASPTPAYATFDNTF